MGCASVESDLDAVLRAYVEAQDSFYEIHGAYGSLADLGEPPSISAEGIRLGVVWRDSVGHGAVAQSRAREHVVCAIFVGDGPSYLRREPRRTPVCGTFNRMNIHLALQVPWETPGPDPLYLPRGARGAAAALLAAAAGLLFLLPRSRPWAYRLTFWPPALLSTGLLGWVLWWAGSGGRGGVVNSGAEGGLLLAIPFLLANLVFWIVPLAIERGARSLRVVAGVGSGLGVLLWGAAGAWLIIPGAEYDPDLFLVALGVSLFHALGLALVIWAPVPTSRQRTSKGRDPWDGSS